MDELSLQRLVARSKQIAQFVANSVEAGIVVRQAKKEAEAIAKTSTIEAAALAEAANFKVAAFLNSIKNFDHTN